MKIFSLLLMLGLVLLTQACAAIPAADATARADYDVVKVALVERYAVRNNIQVIWINYPQARDK